MIVEEIMNKNVVTLPSNATVREAISLMREQKIRHIPIVDHHHKLVGLVTSNTIKNALPTNLKTNPTTSVYDIKIENIMVKDVLVGHPLDFVEEIALTFYEMKISCLPIVSKGQLVGIVTSSNLLYTYIELTGTNKPSSKIDIRVADRPGILSDIMIIFKKHNVNILSVLVFPDSKQPQSKIVTIRAQIMNPIAIIDDLKKEQFEVLWPNLPGVTL
nr:acetoin utilization AcuB family protein [Lysinibacillus timonensis]